MGFTIYLFHFILQLSNTSSTNSITKATRSSPNSPSIDPNFPTSVVEVYEVIVGDALIAYGVVSSVNESKVNYVDSGPVVY